ncbi:DUF7507 domain-containing protein, partial [Shivajiella indica]
AQATDTETITPIAASPSIEITKTGTYNDTDGDGRASAGDQISYTFTVENTGNVTLTGVVVTDPQATVSGTPIAVMAPGAVDNSTFTAVYTLTQADIDAGTFTNVATATGQYNGNVTDTDDDVQNFTRIPSISLSKTANKTSVSAAGEEIVYTLTVTNTGNVTLRNTRKLDPKVSYDNNVGSLAPGESVSINITYVVTQEDIDAGKIENIASVIGRDPNGDEISDEAILVINVPQNPSLSLNKTANKTTVSAAGEEIVYTLTVTNTGNVTINDIRKLDPKVSYDNNVGSLAPGESASINITYVVTQEDIDAGIIENIASVIGRDPKGDETSDEASLVVDVIQNPSLSLNKTANKTTVSAVGEEVVYTLTLTNNGNVTISNINKLDPMLSYDQNIGALAPGESISINLIYVVTQGDLDRGLIENIASVTGQEPSGEEIADQSSATIEVNQNAQLTVVKTADSQDYSEIGQVIGYTIVISNTGNVTLKDIVVKDPLTGLETTLATLSPGIAVSLETSYTVTLEDLERGIIVNNVSATAFAPDGSEINGEDSVTISGEAKQIIANDDAFGDFTVSFTGVLGNILDNDLLDGQRPNPNDVDFEFTELDGIIGLNIDENGELSLIIPGINEAREYTLRYVLRETLNPTNSDDAIVTFRLVNNEGDLSVEKTSNEIEIFEGDEFEYFITVSNLGSTDATDVEIVDDLPAGVSYVSSNFESNNNAIEVNTSVQGSRVTWTIPLLPVEGVVVITMKVKAEALPSDVAQTITNRVSVSSTEEDINPSDNSDTDVNRINPFFIPNVITPDGDGKNDTFEIKGLKKFVQNEIVIFNRYGDHVFKQSNYENGWDAPGLTPGTYFYVLTGEDAQGRKHEFKGWIQVIKKDGSTINKIY